MSVQFRLYIGLISNEQPVTGRLKGQPKAQADFDDDEDFDEDFGDTGKTQEVLAYHDAVAKKHLEEERLKESNAQADDNEDELIEEHHDDVLPDEKEVRMEDFLNNTEMNMKIFFSWYYRDRGLIWYALLFILFSNISISSWSH